MRILFVGGGSGGHVTPLKAIITALPAQANHDLTVITDRKFYRQTQHIFADAPAVRLKRIFAGKYRRYHGQSLLWHIVHLPTLLLNLRDILFLLLGFLQAFIHMIIRRPDVVFAKGGFVSLPVGVAAHILRIPLIIHDSDTHPGLTSRVLSRWAQTIATGMPPEFYPYPKSKMRYTGIPAAKGFAPTTVKQRQTLKQELGFDPKKQLVLVTGGGTGAQRLNEQVANTIETYLRHDWQVSHFTGSGKSGGVRKKHAALTSAEQAAWQIYEFADLLPHVQAADLVVSRAGASALQEFANAQKTVIIVPSPYLSGGHQMKNAELFEQSGAALCLHEADLAADPTLLVQMVTRLAAGESGQAKQLARTLHQKFARPDAAQELAQIILAAK